MKVGGGKVMSDMEGILLKTQKATVDNIYPVKWLFRSVTSILTRSVFGSKENRKISHTILELLADNNF